MSALDELKEGRRVELEVDAEGEKRRFASRVLNALPDAILLELPSGEEADRLFARGKSVRIIVHIAERSVLFESKIQDRQIVGSVALRMSQPTEIKGALERSYTRIPTTLKVEYRRMKNEVTPVSDFQEAETRDLSGGGMMMLSRKKVEKDSLVEVNLELDGAAVSGLGRVTFVAEQKVGMRDMFSAGVAFIALSESDRDKIIKYIFQQERSMLRKGARKK